MKRTIRSARSAFLFSAPLLLPLAGCDPGHGEALGRTRWANCTPCHGPTGAGNREVGAPGIAALPDWYLDRQLHAFRDGARGMHPDDEEGLRMRPMARTLPREEDVTAIVAHVARLEPTHPAATLGGDAARGKTFYQVCTTCHGDKAAGNKEKGAPNLHRSGDWYLLAQLKKFKSGVRGAAPGDANGAQMRAMVNTLPDEQAMKDVIAYIVSLEGPTEVVR